MINKLINFLTNAQTELKDFDEHVQNEIVKYSNRQVKKTAIVCGVIGFVIGAVVF